MDDAKRFLGLARRAGKLAVGVEDVKKAVKAGKAALVLKAKDISPASLGGLDALDIGWTMEEMGAALGIRLCGAAAVTDKGMADTLARKMGISSMQR